MGPLRSRFTRSAERAEHLQARLADPTLDAQGFIGEFLLPPLDNTLYARSFGTLYTAVYRPQGLAASFLWPSQRVQQTLWRFEPQQTVIELGAEL